MEEISAGSGADRCKKHSRRLRMIWRSEVSARLSLLIAVFISSSVLDEDMGVEEKSGEAYSCLYLVHHDSKLTY
jgi:hypothetical protein